MTAISRPLAVLGFVAAILLPVSLNAQVMFERTYGTLGDEYAYAAEQTPDGGYIVCGMADSNETGHKTFLLKTDSLGDSLWMRYYGVPGELSEARCLAQAPDGGYVVAGRSEDGGYVVRTDRDGDSLWAQVGGSMFYAIEPTRDSGFICAGCATPESSSWSDLFLLKLDANGETLWTRTYSGNLGDQANSVRQTADGGYIVAGATTSGGGNPQLWLLRTDSLGDTLWTRPFPGENGSSVRQTPDGGFIVAGWAGQMEAADALLIKTDADGALVWRQTFGGSQGDYLHSVVQTGDGGYAAGGTTDSYGGEDVYIARADGAGNLLWHRALGGSPLDYATTMARTRDSGYVLCCTRYPGHSQTDFDILLIKTDSLGRTAVEEPETPPTRAPGLSLACSPNPASASVTISLYPSIPSSLSALLRLFDASGRRVLSLPVSTSSFVLRTADLPAGIYVARLDCGAQHASVRIVLQR